MKKSVFLAIAFSLFVSNALVAQDSLWSRFYGHTGNGGVFDSDRGMCGTVASDGGYAIGGVSYAFQGLLSEFWLVRTDSNGDTLWTRNYGTVGFEEAHYLIQTDDGGYVLCGDTKPSGGNYNLYIVRTDSLGDTLWTRSFGSPAGDDKGWAIVQTDDGGFLAVGHGYGSGWDVYMVRLNESGDSLWSKKYGGSHPDAAYGVTQTADGGFALVGQYANDDFGDTDLWLLRVDSLGDTLWTRKYSYSGGWSRGEAIAKTSDGGFVIAGQNWLTLTNVVMLLVRTDSLGNEIWHKEYGGPNIDNAMSLDITSDGGIVAGGQTDSFGGGNKDFYIVRTDSSGDSLWSAVFGHNGIDYCHEIRVDPSGDIMAFGQHHIYGSQDFDYWMIKIADSTAQSGCEYVVGDVNDSDSYNGLDITYGVNFFKGGSDPMCPFGSCSISPCDTFFYCGDVNGSCSYNGLDITYGVAYFKSGPDPIPCPDCPPTGD
ncbi:MAG: hypothetical protein JSW64_01480 [Candidatus Zixiibacteriota bacterium]|nr:MAG: hypothetical protein JSW64_01480 [candidate division Zixibacteria bacterium]